MKNLENKDGEKVKNADIINGDTVSNEDSAYIDTDLQDDWLFERMYEWKDIDNIPNGLLIFFKNINCIYEIYYIFFPKLTFFLHKFFFKQKDHQNFKIV